MRIALALVVFLVGLGAAEIALRIAWRRKKPPSGHSWHDYDATLGWRNKKSFKTTVERSEAMPTIPAPFEVRLDAQGLRDDRDMAPEPSAGVTRIACVGDSYTFGFCIPGEAAYPRRLEKALGTGYECWNWGVCAYGLDQFVLALDDVLASKPRLVVLGVIDMSFRRATNANFLDGTAKPRFHLEGDALVLGNVPVPEIKAGDSYCRFEVRGPSYVLAGVERAFENLRVHMSKDPEAEAEDWRLGRALLREASRKCRARGARLVVALLPEERLLAKDRYERLLETLEPEGITVIDTYPAFRSPPASETRPLFVPMDGHPSEAGSDLIAQALAAELKKRRLLD
jgi:hypothetical protein